MTEAGVAANGHAHQFTFPTPVLGAEGRGGPCGPGGATSGGRPSLHPSRGPGSLLLRRHAVGRGGSSPSRSARRRDHKYFRVSGSPTLWPRPSAASAARRRHLHHRSGPPPLLVRLLPLLQPPTPLLRPGQQPPRHGGAEPASPRLSLGEGHARHPPPPPDRGSHWSRRGGRGSLHTPCAPIG